MKTNARRFAAAVAAALLLVFSAGALFGCGQSDEDAIREALTSELDSIKSQDEAFLSNMAADMDVDDFTTYGIDPQEFITKYLTGFDYTIDSITVDGESATAVVTLTCKSFSSYNAAVTAAADDALATKDISSMNQSELNALVGEIMLSALDNIEPVATDPVNIEYTLEGNTWTPTAASEQAITAAMLAN